MGGKPRIIAKTNGKTNESVTNYLKNMMTTVSLPHAMRGRGITTTTYSLHYIINTLLSSTLPYCYHYKFYKDVCSFAEKN